MYMHMNMHMNMYMRTGLKVMGNYLIFANNIAMALQVQHIHIHVHTCEHASILPATEPLSVSILGVVSD